jgi:hypothetical protein
VTFLVTPEGEVSREDVAPLYEDPSEDDLCVD